MNRHQCSSPAIAIFAQEPSASSLCDDDIFAPAARQRSAPVSSAKPSCKPIACSLPHENEMLKIYLRLFRPALTSLSKMNRMSDDAGSFSPKAQTEWRSKPVHQAVRFQTARKGRKKNFHSTPDESRSKKSSSIRGILSLDGQSSPSSTRNALARQSNSKSETQRNCVSILARVCRLKSHPHRRQRAASIGCVSFCWSRNRRICGPTRFRGFFFMFRLRNRNNRECAFSEGSEFRTHILLANSWASSERRCHGGIIPRQTKNLWRTPKEITVM